MGGKEGTGENYSLTASHEANRRTTIHESADTGPVQVLSLLGRYWVGKVGVWSGWKKKKKKNKTKIYVCLIHK